jgi:hypothetical protein
MTEFEMGTSLKDRLTPEYIAPTDYGDVFLYRVGGLSMSVCAPAVLEGEEVAAVVNGHLPCGTERGWQISKDKFFASGEPNPCPCEESDDRLHWYIDC